MIYILVDDLTDVYGDLLQVIWYVYPACWVFFFISRINI